MTRTPQNAGFTLVELTVALVAGLIVGIAVIGLSRDVTATFHEEQRTAAAESALRIAADKLAGDLQRAAFMSTGNIQNDPGLVKGLNGTGVGAQSVYGQALVPPQLRQLASVRLYSGGSFQAVNIKSVLPPQLVGTDDISSLSKLNGLNPDAIDISGNLTSSDAYVVQDVLPTGAACTVAVGGQRVILADDPPSIWRIKSLGAGPAAAVFQAMWQPAAGVFMARIEDNLGKFQYVEICNAGFLNPGGAGVPPTQGFVDIVAATPIITAANSGATGGGAGGTGAGKLVINPVATVRWRVAPTYSTNCTPCGADGGVYDPLNPKNTDPFKFDLVRSWVDGTGAEVGIPELVAEYGVDLKFAFTVDATAGPYPATGPATAMLSYTFDAEATKNSAWANKVDQALSDPGPGCDTNPACNGPQRIRAVRFRVATRTAAPDRTADVIPPGAGTSFLYRYCVDNTASTLAKCTRFARVRTIISEVALKNQARSFWP
jgi:hypothetical protein